MNEEARDQDNIYQSIHSVQYLDTILAFLYVIMTLFGKGQPENQANVKISRCEHPMLDIINDVAHSFTRTSPLRNLGTEVAIVVFCDPGRASYAVQYLAYEQD